MRFRRDWLTADALGRGPEARVELARWRAEFPDDPPLRSRLARVAQETSPAR